MSDNKARKVRSPIIDKIIERTEIPTKLKVFFEMTWLMENIIPDRSATDEEIEKACEWSKKMTSSIMKIFNETSLKKIFVIECSAGDWESFESWIGGVYTDKDKAEQAKDALNAHAKKIQENRPIKLKEGEDSEDLNVEDSKLYWSYYMNNKKWLEWKTPIIKEYKTNVHLSDLINEEHEDNKQ